MNAEEQNAARAHIEALARRTEVIDTLHDGALMRWRRIGHGPHLLLVHGGQGSWLHWVRNVEALSTHFTLWLPDLPASGESDPIPQPHTLESLVAPLHHGLDSLVGADTEVCIAAFSFGAAPAAGLALARGHVPRLALIGGTGHGLPRRSADLLAWRDLPKGPEQDAAHRHNLSQQMLADPQAIDALALVLHREALQRSSLRSRPISRSALMREALDRLDMPVLMLWGEHDVTAQGEATAKALSEGHPNRQWHVVPGGGHWLQYERPELVNELLIDWFSRGGLHHPA